MSEINDRTQSPGPLNANPRRRGRASSWWMGWAVAIVAVVLVVAGLFIAAGRLENGGREDRVEVVMTPVVGGMAMPAGTADRVSPGATGTTAYPVTGTPSEERLVELAPGMTIIGKETDIALFADAAKSAVLLDTYSRGTEFTVLEASGDYSEYPVTRGEDKWIRVRAGDGLVGWTRLEPFLPLP